MTNYRVRLIKVGKKDKVLFDDNVENIFGTEKNYVKVYEYEISSNVIWLEITKESKW